jgi:alpha-L-rhamnosidase
MVAWVRSIRDRAGDDLRWTDDLQWGDWVDPTVDPKTPMSARTDPEFVATAWFARSADLVAEAADATGAAELAAEHRRLAREVRVALQHEWMAPSGRVVADTQTGCALALAYRLVPEEARPVVGARLRRLVQNEQYRVATGFLGTPVLLPALTDADGLADAYRMLFQTNAPGWLYAVKQGATTIWERWDALLPDGSLNAAEEMLSFNHYAFGAIGAWLHGAVGGLRPLEPGFRRFLAAPRPGPGLTSASVVHDGPYGRMAIDWALAGRGLEVQVTVPPNATALVQLPELDRDPFDVGSGQHRFRYGISEDAYRALVAPSGLAGLLGAPGDKEPLPDPPEEAGPR